MDTRTFLTFRVSGAFRLLSWSFLTHRLLLKAPVSHRPFLARVRVHRYTSGKSSARPCDFRLPSEHTLRRREHELDR